MDENELIDGLGRGDRNAYRLLVERYKKKVYFLALDIVGNPSDAEDVFQEVFLKVFRSFSTFKKGSGLSPWLCRITYNAAIDNIRRRGEATDTIASDVIDGLGESSMTAVTSGRSEDPARTAEASLLRDRIDEALKKISPQERAVFVLRHYEGLKISEIADSLGLSSGSVKSYLFRGVDKLRRELGGAAFISSMETGHE